jgi:hypothetical protein
LPTVFAAQLTENEAQEKRVEGSLPTVQLGASNRLGRLAEFAVCGARRILLAAPWGGADNSD